MSHHQSFKNIERLKEFCSPLDGYIALIVFNEINLIEYSVYDDNFLDEYLDKLQVCNQNKLSFGVLRHVNEDFTLFYGDKYLHYRLDLNTGFTSGYDFIDFRYDPIDFKLKFLQLIRKLEDEGS